MMRQFSASVLPLLVAACAAAASAQELSSGVAPSTLTVAHAVLAEADATEAPVRMEYGKEGSKWWSAGASGGHDFKGSSDYGAFAAFSYFLIDDLEIAGQLAVKNYVQPGDDAVGINPIFLFRWHFVNTGAWTIFADAGIGVMFSTDNVPARGTSFNLTPRVGMGFTRRLTDDGTRLMGGLTWAHASNARIEGDHRNPARDEPMVYLGVIWSF